MGVSVVVPCYNEENYIAECVSSLINNGFNINELEILVVDGGSIDNTIKIVNNLSIQYKQVRLINNIDKKTPFALNLGIKNSSYNYILIAGAHAVYPKNYINSLMQLILQPGIDVVGGAIETQVKPVNKKTNAIKFVLSHKLGVGNSLFRIGSQSLTVSDTVPFGLYKKVIFEKVGVYNTKLIRNHDIELSKRIKQSGFNIWLQPQLKVVYYARASYSKLAQNNYGNGFWNIKTLFITKRLNSLSIRHYIPLIFLLSILLPLVVSFFYFPSVFISAISLAFYLVTIFYISIVNKQYSGVLYIVWAFVTLHFAYGFGGLAAFLSLHKK